MKNSGEEDSNEVEKSPNFDHFEKGIKARIKARSTKDSNHDFQNSESESESESEVISGNGTAVNREVSIRIKGNRGAEHIVRKFDEEIENLKANRELRDKYSFKAFKVVKKSLWGWAILLFIYGLVKLLTRHENGGFEIFSDHVLIAITTATTLNIYAGFLSLIRGLFPSTKEYNKEK